PRREEHVLLRAEEEKARREPSLESLARRVRRRGRAPPGRELLLEARVEDEEPSLAHGAGRPGPSMRAGTERTRSTSSGESPASRRGPGWNSGPRARCGPSGNARCDVQASQSLSPGSFIFRSHAAAN